MILGVSPLRGDRPAGWKHLFLRYPTGIDPTRHCSGCFVGGADPRVSPGRLERGTLTLRPDVPYAYLCGVASSGDWNDNLHLAVAPAPDGFVEVLTHLGDVFYVQGARRLDIPELADGWMGLDRGFTRCRMFRWAVATWGYDPPKLHAAGT